MLESRAVRGAVAQLGERRVRNAKVEGSIPFRSTIPPSSGQSSDPVTLPPTVLTDAAIRKAKPREKPTSLQPVKALPPPPTERASMVAV